MAKNLIKTIQNTIFQQELFKRGAKIVVGVSGGSDSTCLLDVLAKLTPKYGLQLIIAHVNYGLRGKDSDKDEKFVRELVEKYRIKIEVLNYHRGRIPLDQNSHKGSDPYKVSENVLRETRYAFFEKVRKENKFDLIAVAHNADDQVETFLMRIIRGAGLRGLAAMKYKAGNIIRPLLGISRKEILEYLKNHKRIYRTDKTNLQSLFFRNKIRNKLVPFLEKNFNPNIRQTIFRAAENISEDYALISDLAEQAEKNLAQLSVHPRTKALFRRQKVNTSCSQKYSHIDQGSLRFGVGVKKILSLHPALQREVIRIFLGKIKSDLKDIESAHIAEVVKILKSTKGKNQTVLFKGLKIERKGDIITILKN